MSSRVCDAADVAHDLRALDARISHARIARRSGSRPCFAITFSDMRTLMPSTMSAFSASARAAISGCA